MAVVAAALRRRAAASSSDDQSTRPALDPNRDQPARRQDLRKADEPALAMRPSLHQKPRRSDHCAQDQTRCCRPQGAAAARLRKHLAEIETVEADACFVAAAAAIVVVVVSRTLNVEEERAVAACADLAALAGDRGSKPVPHFACCAKSALDAAAPASGENARLFADAQDPCQILWQ